MRDASFRPQRGLAALLAVAATLAALASAPAAGKTAAAAPDASQAQRTLDRFLAALGGRAAVMSQRTSHLVGTVSAFGLTGTTEGWTERPDRSASITKLGPFTIQEGCDGTQAWRTDPSGKLLILDGKDLDRAKAGAWFENDRYLDDDHGGATIAWVGNDKDSLGSYDVIDVAPPVDKPRRMWFDSKTGLLARESLKEDQQTVETRLSDWRNVGGRLTAFRTHSEVSGMPMNAITLTIDSVQVNVAIEPSRFAPPAAAASGVHWLKQDGVAKLPFEYRGRHVWLRASINGAPPADFLFDTGASITVLDSAYAAKLGIQTEGHMQAMGAGSTGGASFATVKSLRVAAEDGDGVELTDQKIGVLSVNDVLAPFFWRDCAGVLGFSFISQFVDEIDFDHLVLTLRDPKSFQYQGTGTKLPMTLAGTVPVVKMTIDRSVEGEYRLDVGSNSTVDLHAPFVKQHQLDQSRGKTVEAHGAGFGGQFTSRVTRAKRLDLGPYGWNDPIVTFSGATTGGLASEDYAGNVGNQVLERFKCTFDYEHRVVYLEPGAQYAKTDHFSRAGLLLLKTGDSVTVGQVLGGSPADKAGLKEGDRIVSLDGKPILSWQMNDLMTLFEQGEEGRKLSIEAERDGKPRKVMVTLKEML